MQSTSSAPAPAAGTLTPGELLKSKQYVAMLVVAGIIGAPIATFAFFFLKLVAVIQKFLYQTLVGDLGFHHEPLWWPLPLLALCGLIVALTIRYLPGTGGHKPAEGFKMSPTRPIEFPGVFLAALATLSLGAVLGPEGPLVAMGGALGVLAMGLIKRDAPRQAMALMGAAGSFAAISTLLGNPLVAAFLLLEAGGGGAMGGPMLGPLLMPGLLAAGVGALIFVGLDNWTGFGTFSLATPNIPAFHTPTGAEFLWAIAIGILAALLATLIRSSALSLQGIVEKRMVLLTPIMGVVVAVAAIVFCAISGKSSNLVLFSGQSSLPGLIENASAFSAGTLVLLCACKSIAYSASLSSLRGGPVFPSMFIGAAGGIALSHLPGLPMIAGAAMGIGAMCAAMLGLPMTSVLLATLLVVSDGIRLLPLIIVAVVISYVVSARFAPAPARDPAEPAGASGPEGAAVREPGSA